VVAFLEVCLREGNDGKVLLKCGRIKVPIGDLTEGVKCVLNSALDIKEPVIKVALCETVIRLRLLKLEESLLGEVWARRVCNTLPFPLAYILLTGRLFVNRSVSPVVLATGKLVSRHSEYPVRLFDRPRTETIDGSEMRFSHSGWNSRSEALF
jgi:hypothetical protein